MGKIKVYPKGIMQIRPRLTSIEIDLEAILSHLSYIEHKPQNLVNKKDIQTIRRSIGNLQTGVSRLSRFLWDSAIRYEVNEEEIVRSAQTIFNINVVLRGLTIPESTTRKTDLNWTATEASFKNYYLNYKDKDGIAVEKADKIFNRKTGEKVPKEAERVGTLIEVKAEGKIEKSALKSEIETKGEYGTGKAGVKVLNASAVGELSAGFYVYDDKGNKFLSPGVKAEVGVSVSLIEVSAEGKVGLGKDNELLGAYGDVKARAGAAEAKATFIAGLYNAKGEVDVNAKAGAKAGVYAGEIEGSVGGTVMGIDAGVTGKLNVGLGGSADIGITGGKVKGEIGLSIGVGFKIGFEIDVGGFIGACKSLIPAT